MVILAVEAWFQRGTLVMRPADRRSSRLADSKAIERGLKEESREFVEQGSEVYANP